MLLNRVSEEEGWGGVGRPIRSKHAKQQQAFRVRTLVIRVGRLDRNGSHQSFYNTPSLIKQSLKIRVREDEVPGSFHNPSGRLSKSFTLAQYKHFKISKHDNSHFTHLWIICVIIPLVDRSRTATKAAHDITRAGIQGKCWQATHHLVRRGHPAGSENLLWLKY